MMLRRKWIMLAALAVAAQPAQAQVSAGAKKELAAIYKRIDAATQKQDMRAAMAHLAPDFRATYRNGMTLNVSQLRDTWKQQAGMIKYSSVRTRIRKFSAEGRNVIVLSDSVMIGTMKPPGATTAEPVEFFGSAQDVWVKTSRGWRSTKAKSLGIKIKMQGRTTDTGM